MTLKLFAHLSFLSRREILVLETHLIVTGFFFQLASCSRKQEAASAVPGKERENGGGGDEDGVYGGKGRRQKRKTFQGVGC